MQINCLNIKTHTHTPIYTSLAFVINLCNFIFLKLNLLIYLFCTQFINDWALNKFSSKIYIFFHSV